MKRNINELPEGLRNRMIRLTIEYAVLSETNLVDRLKSLDNFSLTYKMWQTRSYFLMKAINQRLLKEGKAPKYEFTK